MNIDPSLLEILVCPACRAEVRLDEAAEELVCRGCGLAYPVRDDIPVMLVDEARRPAPPTRREPVQQQPLARQAAAEGPGDVPDPPAGSGADSPPPAEPAGPAGPTSS